MIKMKPKILYLIEGPVELAIAKSIQKQFDCELFGLIDTNKQMSKSLKNQNLLNFEKIWCYRECVTKTFEKPNLDYLVQFEKMYGINLWMIAFSDRILYQFNKYYKFSYDEILFVLEQACKFFEEILNHCDPDFVIIKNPDYFQSELLFQLCHAKNIKILTLSHSRLGYRYFISEHTDRLDNVVDKLQKFSGNEKKSLAELRSYIHGYSTQTKDVPNEYQISIRKKLQASIRYLLFVCNAEYRKYPVNFGRTRFNILKNETLIILKRFYREFFIKNNFKKNLDFDTPFVYFPLHFQPERSTLIATPFYANQIEVVKHIAKSLPIGYKLYVKEHPFQIRNGWRDLSYYKTILDLPNVELIHPDVKNEDFLKKSSLVITIAGTLGLEAAFYGKPSIVFSDVIYSHLPSVYRVKNLEELPKIIRSCINTSVNSKDLDAYVNCIVENSFDYDAIALDIDLLNRFYCGGFLYDVEISSEQMNSMIVDYEQLFDKLALQYIKKIQNWN